MLDLIAKQIFSVRSVRTHTHILQSSSRRIAFCLSHWRLWFIYVRRGKKEMHVRVELVFVGGQCERKEDNQS